MPFDRAVLVNPSVRLERGESYPFVDMKAVNPGSRSVGPSELRKFSGGGSRFMHGDTLMARITPCLENGKIARYASPDSKSVGHGSTEFIVIRGRPQVTDSVFAYYLTKSDGVRQYCISQMTGSSGRQRVPMSALSHREVTIPPMKEQRRIADILGALDDKIELNRKMNATLEAMARAIFKSWFIDFDPVHAKAQGRPPDGMGAETARLFPSEFEASEIGPVPKGWRVRPLDAIASFLNGLACQKYPPTGDESMPVIKIADLRNGVSDTTDRASPAVGAAYIVKNGDVLFSWSGSLLVKIWTGGKGVLNQHLFKVTSGNFPRWFYYFWIRERLLEFQSIAQDKATTMGHIKRHHLNDARVVVPDPAVLKAADAIIAPLVARCVQCDEESATLDVVRDTLLPRLLSGEVAIPAPKGAG